MPVSSQIDQLSGSASGGRERGSEEGKREGGRGGEGRAANSK